MNTQDQSKQLEQDSNQNQIQQEQQEDKQINTEMKQKRQRSDSHEKEIIQKEQNDQIPKKQKEEQKQENEGETPQKQNNNNSSKNNNNNQSGEKISKKKLKLLQEQSVLTCKYYLNGICSDENCYNKHEDCQQYIHTQQCRLQENCRKFHRKLCEQFRRTQKCDQNEKCQYVHKVCKKTVCNCMFYHINQENQKVYNIQYSLNEREGNGEMEQFEKLCMSCNSWSLPAYLACGHDGVCRVCVNKQRGGDNYVDRCLICDQRICGIYII